jgi:NADH dehydrogenase [ubiquinone] 1 alpha subcomplex assembly factor 1
LITFSEQKDFDNWTSTADSDHGEGTSTAKWEKSPAGYAIFHGNLSSELPRDGKIKRSGYCNVRSSRARKSFMRDAEHDWTLYNTLVLKVRGDGRPYLINLSCEGYYDVSWNDIYHYILYTRGGPHWQITKIPFSKFFYASKGRVQDLQTQIPLNRITHLGFSVSSRGGYQGNFGLEIDYVGLEYDPAHTEEFAYEMYKADKFIIAT